MFSWLELPRCSPRLSDGPMRSYAHWTKVSKHTQTHRLELSTFTIHFGVNGLKLELMPESLPQMHTSQQKMRFHNLDSSHLTRVPIPVYYYDLKLQSHHSPSCKKCHMGKVNRCYHLCKIQKVLADCEDVMRNKRFHMSLLLIFFFKEMWTTSAGLPMSHNKACKWE